MLFQLRAISKSFEGKPVLTDISFSVKKGEWLGIVGESGSGKTTLLRIMGRLLDQDAGELLLNGEALPSVASQLLKGHAQIKMVQQEFGLFPNVSVLDNVAYPLRLAIEAHRNERAAALIELTGLRKVQHQLVKSLSGGEKQRTAIAQSIADLPALLLMDEPFAHLDTRNKAKLVEVVGEIRRKQSISGVFVTHDASEAFALADRLVVLRAGRILQTGTPKEVYDKPQTSYCAQLLGAVNWCPRRNKQGKLAYIRPEHCMPTEKESTKVDWSGKVKLLLFRGSFWEVVAENSTGAKHRLYAHSSDWAIGDPVHLVYDSAKIGWVDPE
jgi:iron(III) transport system ATP-binding protein